MNVWIGAMMAACSVAVAVDAPSPPDDVWSLPKWAVNDQPIRGTFQCDAKTSPDTVRIRFQIGDADATDVEVTVVAAREHRVEFTLPKLPYDTFGIIHIWAEDAVTGDRIGSERNVAAADWREFDISGVTDVELLFPMQSWGMQVRFTPCCLINAGYLRAERVPINPAKDATGLPKTLASDFLHLAPDPTVVATSGLNAEIAIDEKGPFAESPQDVTVYEWYKGRWIPVLGAELHEETNTIRFSALEGGYFVLAAKPGLRP